MVILQKCIICRFIENVEAANDSGSDDDNVWNHGGLAAMAAAEAAVVRNLDDGGLLLPFCSSQNHHPNTSHPNTQIQIHNHTNTK